MSNKKKSKFLNIIVVYVLTMIFLITAASFILIWFKGIEPEETLKWFYSVCAVELLAMVRLELSKEKSKNKEIQQEIINDVMNSNISDIV